MAEGFHDFAAAEVLTAANVDDYLLRQTVMRFASAAARDSALSGVLVEGLRAYTKDVNRDWIYTGSAWVLLPGMNPPRCKATLPGGQNIETATITAVSLQTEIYDSDALHDNSTNPTRILLNQVGRWAIWYTVRFAQNAAGTRVAWMGINTAGAGSGNRYGYVEVSPYTGGGVTTPILSSYDEYDATATTDYVELFAYQTCGSTLAAGNSAINYDLSLSVRYIGPIF